MGTENENSILCRPKAIYGVGFNKSTRYMGAGTGPAGTAAAGPMLRARL